MADFEEFPSDGQIHQLSKYIGNEIHELAAYLGIEQHKVERIKSDHSTARNKNFHILLRWRDRSSLDAEDRSKQLQECMTLVGREPLVRMVQDFYQEYTEMYGDRDRTYTKTGNEGAVTEKYSWTQDVGTVKSLQNVQHMDESTSASKKTVSGKRKQAIPEERESPTSSKASFVKSGRSSMQVTNGPVVDSLKVCDINEEQIQIICRYKYTSPPPDYEWYKDGHRIQKDNRHSFSVVPDSERNFLVNSLTLLNTGSLVDGVYKCVLSNDYGEDYKEIPLQVLKPRILAEPKDVQAMQGKSFNIVCDFQNGKDKPNIKWRKDGLVIKQLEHGFEQHDGPSDQRIKKRRTELIKKTATLDDSGHYTCVITNTFGRADGTAKVTITDVNASDAWPTIRNFLNKDKELDVFTYYLDELENQVVITAKVGTKSQLEKQLDQLNVSKSTYVVKETVTGPKLLGKLIVDKSEETTESTTITAKVKDNLGKKYLMTCMHLFESTPGGGPCENKRITVNNLKTNGKDLTNASWSGVFDTHEKDGEDWWIDVAIVKLDNENGIDFGRYKKCKYIYSHNCRESEKICDVYKVGATSGLTSGRVCLKAVYNHHGVKASAYVVKSDCHGFLCDGDSGSLVTTEIDEEVVNHSVHNHALGIAFASHVYYDDSKSKYMWDYYISPLNLCLEKLSERNNGITYSLCSGIQNCP